MEVLINLIVVIQNVSVCIYVCVYMCIYIIFCQLYLYKTRL